MQLAPCFWPKTLTIYEIPIEDCGKVVYMKPNGDAPRHTVIFVRVDRFLSSWADAPYFDDPPFQAGVPYSQNLSILHGDRKLGGQSIENWFLCGLANPVSVPILDTIQNRNIRLRDGTTRIIWLITRKAKAFPLACPPIHVEELKLLAGIELE